MNINYVHTFEVPFESVDKGNIKVYVTQKDGRPVSNAVVTLSYAGDPENILGEIRTNRDGIAEFDDLATPPLEYSMEPGDRQPFSEFNIYVTAFGYEDVEVSGSDLFSGQVSILEITMQPIRVDETLRTYVIPVNTLYGDYPPKIEESEIKNITQSGEIVLSKVVVPQTIVVHDGPPNDNNAINYYVPYRDYIKNVACSEIYSTWPDETIRANVYAIMSFSLNRVYTEWYRNKNYNFVITSSTAYDQKWVNGRNIFESISRVVDEIFDCYISRPNIKQPILAQYCDGKRVICPGRLSQWGSKSLGDENYTAIEILRYYYGDDVYINRAEEISGIPRSWPGEDLDIGSMGEPVRLMQELLNGIGEFYPDIEPLVQDGIFGERTARAVAKFQSLFNLNPTGIVDYPTWYKISDRFVRLTNAAELI